MDPSKDEGHAHACASVVRVRTEPDVRGQSRTDDLLRAQGRSVDRVVRTVIKDTMPERAASLIQGGLYLAVHLRGLARS